MQTVTRRKPILSFHRPAGLEAAVRVVLFWNGSLAGNGDGIGGGSDAIDYDTVLAGPIALDAIDPLGRRGGWCAGGWCEGAWAAGVVRWRWAFPFLLRDGQYSVGALLEDSLGNRQADPGVEVSFRVVAVPRPPSGFRITAYAAPTLSTAWIASPEFAA